MVDQSSDLKLDQDGNPIRLLQGCLITVTAPLRISFLVSKILAGKWKKKKHSPQSHLDPLHFVLLEKCAPELRLSRCRVTIAPRTFLTGTLLPQ
jgi:hypothetical protein